MRNADPDGRTAKRDASALWPSSARLLPTPEPEVRSVARAASAPAHGCGRPRQAWSGIAAHEAGLPGALWRSHPAKRFLPGGRPPGPLRVFPFRFSPRRKLPADFLIRLSWGGVWDSASPRPGWKDSTGWRASLELWVLSNLGTQELGPQFREA